MAAGAMPGARDRKACFAVLAAVAAAGAVSCAVALGARGGDGDGLEWIGIAVVTAAAGAGAALVRSMEAVPEKALLGVLCAVGVGQAVGDVHAGALLADRTTSAVFVLLGTMGIACGGGRRATMALLGGAALWTTLAEVEKATRGGLLDGWGTPSYQTRHAALCECSRPPCGGEVDATIRNALFSAVAVVGNAVIVAGLADRGCGTPAAPAVDTEAGAAARSSRRDSPCPLLEEAFEVLTKAASLLADFDLTGSCSALDELEGAPHVPADYVVHLRRLHRNLQACHPFIPTGVVETSASGRSTSGPAKPAPPVDQGVPGASGNPIAVVFSDIRQSTNLWESSPEPMKHALHTHNAIIREELHMLNGYEVKTIGDAFMITFDSAADAVKFGVAVQAKFAETALWPHDLSRLGSDDGFPMFAVRMGIHFGPVTLEKNVLTDRYDYFGSTVNKAARVEANGVVGAVTVTPAALDAIEDADLMEGLVCVQFAELRQMKGFEEGLQLTALLGSEASGEELARVRKQCGVEDREDSPSHVVADVAASLTIFNKVNAWKTRAVGGGAAGVQDALATDYANYAVASCGALKFAFWKDTYDRAYWNRIEDHAATALQLVFDAVSQTDGTLSAVVSNVAAVSWGCITPCSQHLNKSAHFLSILYRDMTDAAGDPVATPSTPSFKMPADDVHVMPPPTPSVYFHAGLVTGRMGSGRVAASPTARYATVLGPCVELSLALCNGAAELKTHALVASTSDKTIYKHHCVTALSPHMKQVDTWGWRRDWCPATQQRSGRGKAARHRLRGGRVPVSGSSADDISQEEELSTLLKEEVADAPPQQPTHGAVAVYDLCVVGLAKVMLHSRGRRSGEASPLQAFSKAYARAYRARDVAAIRRWSSDYPLLGRVADMLEGRTSLQHALMFMEAASPSSTPPSSTAPVLDVDDSGDGDGAMLGMMRNVRRLSTASPMSPL